MRKSAFKALFETKLSIPTDRIEHYEQNWGVCISKITDDSTENLSLCNVSWKDVFPDGLSLAQSFFINGIVDKCPRSKTFGQYLYLVAARESIQKDASY